MAMMGATTMIMAVVVAVVIGGTLYYDHDHGAQVELAALSNAFVTYFLGTFLYFASTPVKMTCSVLVVLVEP